MNLNRSIFVVSNQESGDEGFDTDSYSGVVDLMSLGGATPTLQRRRETLTVSAIYFAKTFALSHLCNFVLGLQIAVLLFMLVKSSSCPFWHACMCRTASSISRFKVTWNTGAAFGH